MFAVVAAGAAVLAPGAQAGARVDYKQAFTTSMPGTATGTDTQLLYKHPDDPNAKPIPVRREVFTFPRGVRHDEGVVPDCNATDAEIMLFARAACPEESWMGGGIGDTTMTGFDGSETPIDVDGWDQGGTLVLLGRDHSSGIGFVTRARREGRIVTVEVPFTPGSPPDGGALRRVHNVFAARTLGDRAYMRTPRRCPRSGFWKFTGQFTFADGVTERHVSRMPCTQK